MVEESPRLIRTLMAATITDVAFLKGLRLLWMEDLAGSSWGWVARTSFDYLDRHHEAPGRNIQTLFEGSHLDPETKGDILHVLSGLSGQWEAGELGDTLNADHLLEEARKWFTRELYLREAYRLESAAEAGDLEAAREVLESIRPPVLPTITAINPALHPDLLKSALESQPEPLVRLGGALQELVGVQLTQDSFVAFLGREKVGKTWHLAAIALSALKAGTAVLFCQCGDLSLGQQLTRFAIQLTGRSNRERYCGEQLVPVPDCELNQRDNCSLGERDSVGTVSTYDPQGRGEEDSRFSPAELMSYRDTPAGYQPCFHHLCSDLRPSSWWEPVAPCPPLDWQSGADAWRRMNRAWPGMFMLEWFPNGAATVEELDRRLHQLREQSDWPPPGKKLMVVADYLDIFGVEPGSASKEFRHREDAKWRAARRLSQDWECCLVTATQATMERGNRRVLRQRDTSEDKRKGAHVTAMFGLNCTEEDHRRGWLRVNPILVREDDYNVNDQVAVLRLLQRGVPNAGSFWLVRAGERG
jgi:hypothetical protein